MQHQFGVAYSRGFPRMPCSVGSAGTYTKAEPPGTREAQRAASGFSLASSVKHGGFSFIFAVKTTRITWLSSRFSAAKEALTPAPRMAVSRVLL